MPYQLPFPDLTEALPAAAWCRMARESYAAGLDMLADKEAEYQSECSMFGDAGPGAALSIRALRETLDGMAARYRQITGADLAAVAWSVYEDPAFIAAEESNFGLITD